MKLKLANVKIINFNTIFLSFYTHAQIHKYVPTLNIIIQRTLLYIYKCMTYILVKVETHVCIYTSMSIHILK